MLWHNVCVLEVVYWWNIQMISKLAHHWFIIKNFKKLVVKRLPDFMMICCLNHIKNNILSNSYIHVDNFYTDKITSLCWILLVIFELTQHQLAVKDLLLIYSQVVFSLPILYSLFTACCVGFMNFPVGANNWYRKTSEKNILKYKIDQYFLYYIIEDEILTVPHSRPSVMKIHLPDDFAAQRDRNAEKDFTGFYHHDFRWLTGCYQGWVDLSSKSLFSCLECRIVFTKIENDVKWKLCCICATA